MGIFYSLWAALFFSVSHITLRKGVTKLGVSSGTIIMLLSGTATTLAIALCMDGIGPLRTADPEAFVYFTLGGLLHFLGGWGFQNLSASLIGPTRVSAVTGSAPLFAAFLAFITLDQAINIYILGGIVLIAGGVLILTLVGSHEKK